MVWRKRAHVGKLEDGLGLCVLTSIDNGQPATAEADGRALDKERGIGVVEIAQVDGAHAGQGGIGVGALDDGVVAGRAGARRRGVASSPLQSIAGASCRAAQREQIGY